MKKFVSVLLASLLLAQLFAALPTPAAAQSSSPVPPALVSTYNVTVPTDLSVYIPCALGGQGEDALLSGPLHIQFHVTQDPAGGYHYEDHFQPQDITGVGLTSGSKYIATGVTRDSGSFRALPYNFSYVNNFRIIGPGTGSYLVHENLHITINANGVVTAYADNYSVDCK